jgi:hypothetical protein
MERVIFAIPAIPIVTIIPAILTIAIIIIGAGMFFWALCSALPWALF